MADKPRLGAGNVDIELNGETRTLKPSLRAAKGISQQFGGFQKAFDSIAALDLDTFIAVVALGLNVTGEDAKEIPDLVWRTGMPNLAEPIARYLSILANGGRPIDDTGGEEQENPQAG